MTRQEAPDTVAPEAGPVPGEATRRYLRALAERGPVSVDWSAAPPTHKRYPTAGRVVLPWRAPSPIGDLLRGLLGVTRAEWTHRTGVRLKRPAPSGGALYPIEAYVALGDPAGLYHYDPAHHALDLVRVGDHRTLLHASLTCPPAEVPDMVVVLTAVFWRNGFKYRDFAYRLHCQEVGVLGAQVLVVGESSGLDTAVHLRFDDAVCQSLLGLDPTREGVLAAFTCTSGAGAAAGPLPRSSATGEEHPPPSVVGRLPHLSALHAAAAAATGSGALPALPPVPAGPLVALPAPRALRLADGLPLRGSPEIGFLPREIDARDLATILAHASAGYPGDVPGCHRAPVTLTPHILVQRVRGVPAGAYRYDPDTGRLVATAGTGRVEAGPLQPNTREALPEASAILVPAGDQTAGIAGFGDRWYRLQQAEAGLVVHRGALAAAAAGLAARIHSDGTNPITDAALGLSDPVHGLSFLLLGVPRPGMTVTAPLR
ncbi:SagB-type dehydrogenase family enzyme [Saccharothrix ecbatanensis]|uniref:SagB-type dehydrogenase family enzyme n=1 Tax=Saccharothrix ecbatanensis TaxID=1105145 RepID=A0A7W9HJS2_9PSEU|nr:SagB family peptide dehydrogenase [Saccharothrix ecbatanensis]MBB5803286.1 SagB-type dehydrogenase family enzyme [Saccharothrix ecbatanensis]